jgi:Icc-related predicted phosphoesterase
MRVLVFSDIHGDTRALEKIVAQPADIYVADGDLSTFGRRLDRCGEILAALGERLWVLPGNHESHEESREFCRRFGFVDFHRQVRQLGETSWVGLGYSNITPFKTPGEYTEEQIAEALAAFDGLKTLYIVAHVPPRDSQLDEFAVGKHAGSSALRTWIEREKPDYLFCGHIHECAGREEMIGRTRSFNVGKAGVVVEV